MELPRRVGRESDGRWTKKRNFEWLSHCEWFEIKGERWDQEIESCVRHYWSTSEWETIFAKIRILFNYRLSERVEDNDERLIPKSEDWRFHISVPSITIIRVWREKENHPCERDGRGKQSNGSGLSSLYRVRESQVSAESRPSIVKLLAMVIISCRLRAAERSSDWSLCVLIIVNLWEDRWWRNMVQT